MSTDDVTAARMAFEHAAEIRAALERAHAARFAAERDRNAAEEEATTYRRAVATYAEALEAAAAGTDDAVLLRATIAQILLAGFCCESDVEAARVCAVTALARNATAAAMPGGAAEFKPSGGDPTFVLDTRGRLTIAHNIKMGGRIFIDLAPREVSALLSWLTARGVRP